jgi:hypothetical protein
MVLAIVFSVAIAVPLAGQEPSATPLPAAQGPGTQRPGKQGPAKQRHGTQGHGNQGPGTQGSRTQGHGTQGAGTQRHGTQGSDTQGRGTQDQGTKRPGTQDQGTQGPSQTVPSIMGRSPQDVNTILGQHGLRGMESGREPSTDYRSGTVIRQDPSPNAPIPENRLVRYWAAQGPSQTVPSIMGGIASGGEQDSRPTWSQGNGEWP